MKSNKELIKEILTQPAHFTMLAEETSKPNRKRFYNAIKEPICISPQTKNRYLENCRDHIVYILRYYDFIEFNLNYNISYDERFDIVITDSSVDIQQNTIKLSAQVTIDGTRKPFSMTSYKKVSKAIEELNALLLTHPNKRFKTALAEIFSRPQAEVEKNNTIKQQTNLIKSLNEQYYVYFTHISHADHYVALREAERLSSCMSKDYDYFGLSNRGNSVHPLMGYSYAPDFALALVSKLNPNQMAELAEQDNPDYPFIARSMVFTGDDDDPVYFARFYGNEICRNCFVEHFYRTERPVNLQLYAVRVTDISNGTMERIAEDHYNIYKELTAYFNDTSNNFYCEPKAFLVVPYIDEYANTLCFSNNPSPLIFEEDERDGLEKVLVTTQSSYYESDNMSEQTFGVFHCYGLAFAHDDWEHLEGLVYQDTDNQARIHWDNED